jgi:hypothetical protein
MWRGAGKHLADTLQATDLPGVSTLFAGIEARGYFQTLATADGQTAACGCLQVTSRRGLSCARPMEARLALLSA